MGKSGFSKVTGLMILVLAITFASLGYHSANAKNSSTGSRYTIDQLSQAVLDNNTDLVQRIIQSKSVDINHKDSHSTYPIEQLLVMDNCPMARILLKAGANPHVITADGKSMYDKVMNGDNALLKSIFQQYRGNGKK